MFSQSSRNVKNKTGFGSRISLFRLSDLHVSCWCKESWFFPVLPLAAPSGHALGSQPSPALSMDQPVLRLRNPPRYTVNPVLANRGHVSLTAVGTYHHGDR